MTVFSAGYGDSLQLVHVSNKKLSPIAAFADIDETLSARRQSNRGWGFFSKSQSLLGGQINQETTGRFLLPRFQGRPLSYSKKPKPQRPNNQNDHQRKVIYGFGRREPESCQRTLHGCRFPFFLPIRNSIPTPQSPIPNCRFRIPPLNGQSYVIK